MPKVFGPEHLIYVCCAVVLMATILIVIKKYVKSERSLSLIIHSVGIVLLCAIVWNRLSICMLRDGMRQLLPGSFCGTSSLVLSLSAIFCKKDSPIFHCVAYIGGLGGLLTLIYPDFIGQADSIFYPMTISGLVHHTVMVLLVLIMLKTGYLKPSLKKWHYYPIGMSLYMVYGLFLLDALHYGSAMYIDSPILEGTFLYWWVLGPIALALHTLFLLLWTYAEQNKNKKNATYGKTA